MLGFLVKTYPKVSETFVLQEILALQGEPLGLQIFAMQKPTDNEFHSAYEQVYADVDYLTSGQWRDWSSWRKHLDFMRIRPLRYLKTLWFSLTRSEGGTFSQFGQAVCFAVLAEAKGIRHIHAHFASEPAGLAELLKCLSGISYSISAHAKDIYVSDDTCLARKIASARFVVTCTEYNRRYLQSINAAETPIYRVYHGIDAARIMAENQHDVQGVGVIRILSVGRLREKKGFRFLIGACQRLVQIGYRFQCDIVGYGPDRDELTALIESYGLNGIVRLLGKMTHDELVMIYRQTSIFALPSLIAADGDRDRIPNVLMEAMTFSIPVVSTQVSGIPELVETGKCGLLVEPGDTEALFDALKLLLDRPELRSRLGEAGYRRVAESFAASQHIGRLKKLLTDTLQSNRSVSPHNITAETHHG